MREQLGATDQEWKTLGPQVMKVDELNQQISGPGRGGMFFGGRRRGPQGDQPGGAQPSQMTAIEKATEQLRAALDEPSSTAPEIKKHIVALREAREKVKKELVAAQQALRKAVNARQEGRLVLMGLLD